MKKIISILLAAILVTTIAACTKSTDKKDVSKENSGITSSKEDKSNSSDTASSKEDKSNNSDIPKKEAIKETIDEGFSKLPEKLEAKYVSDKFTMEVSFYFENNKAVNGYVKHIYADEKQAKSVYDSYAKNAEYYANVKREGKELSYVHTEKSFEAYKGMTKEEVKSSLEKSGFTIVE
ncbi:MAG: hypothetical protein Q8882_04495 [Bacillota bacterium]|nr:hypothetical protein [Bacillota bacterium]